MNVQYAVKDGEIFVSVRSIRAPAAPYLFVAKAIGTPVCGHRAAKVMAGEKLSSFKVWNDTPEHVAVKEAVMPFCPLPRRGPGAGPGNCAPPAR